MNEQEFRTVECLTFLRAASASIDLAIPASAGAKLPDDIREQMKALNTQLNGLVTKVWNTIGTDE